MNLQSKSVELERIMFSCSEAIRFKELLMGADLRVVVPHNMASMLMQLTGYLYGERMDEVTVSYPADWKESLKERFFPEWLKSRYPIRRTTHTMKAYTMYPDFRPSLPDQRTFQVVQRSSHTTGDWE